MSVKSYLVSSGAMAFSKKKKFNGRNLTFMEQWLFLAGCKLKLSRGSSPSLAGASIYGHCSCQQSRYNHVSFSNGCKIQPISNLQDFCGSWTRPPTH